MKRRQHIFLILPTIVVYSIVTIIPFVYVLYLSVCKWILYDPTIRGFCGLGNYIEILTSRSFWKAVQVTLTLTMGSVLVEFIIGFGIALLLYQPFKGAKFVRSILIFPMVVAPIVVSLIWRTAYDPDFGLINYALSLIGINGPNWLASPQTALLSVMLVDVWQWTPYMSLILISGLQSLPQYFYEAAEIDGASKVQSFFYITIPLLRQVILIAIIFRTMGVFRSYDLIYGLTSGGPGSATTNASFYAYKVAFLEGSIGKGSAASVILVIFVMIICYYLSEFMGEMLGVYKK